MVLRSLVLRQMVLSPSLLRILWRILWILWPPLSSPLPPRSRLLPRGQEGQFALRLRERPASSRQGCKRHRRGSCTQRCSCSTCSRQGCFFGQHPRSRHFRRTQHRQHDQSGPYCRFRNRTPLHCICRPRRHGNIYPQRFRHHFSRIGHNFQRQFCNNVSRQQQPWLFFQLL